MLTVGEGTILLNRVVLIGRLTKDPELRYTPSGVPVTTFTLAVDRNYTNSQGEREADFIPIVTWRQLAELCANYLKKGRLTALEGRIQTRHYDNQDGRRVYVTEVVADNVRFIDSNRDRQDQTPYAYGSPSGRGSKEEEHRPANEPFAGESEPINLSEDDLPF
ncbi:Single-stranded DNA-binding protein [[Clostridium] ultunense Esp]|nr:Single-stranded DNA-binding protein [[Clostridium] ultunense Esp]